MDCLHEKVGVCCPREITGLVELRRVFPHDDCVLDHPGHLGALRAEGKSESQPRTEI